MVTLQEARENKVLVLKGMGNFWPNFQNCQKIRGHHSYKKVRWRHILINKLPKS